MTDPKGFGPASPAALPPTFRDRLWLVYLGAGGVVLATYLLLASAGAQAIAYEAVGASAALAIIVGVRLHRPLRRLPWYLLACGQLLWLVGDVLWDVFALALDIEPFPSAADVFYLAGYPVTVLGLLVLIRSRAPDGDRASFIDSAIVTTGVAVIAWVFLIDPYIRDPSLTDMERLVSVAYPVADVLLLGVAVRLLAAPGARSTAYGFLAVSLGFALVADTAFAVLTLAGGGVENGPLDLVWLAGYLAWGAAALHPSMRTMAEPATEPEQRLTRTRLAFLAGAALLVPTVLAIQGLRGAPIDVPVIAAGSACVFVLVVARMAGLVGTLASTLRHREALEAALTHQAFHDSLTELANRALFTDRADHALARRGTADDSVAVLLLDLDDFKTINDSLGHAAGDQLLVGVAARIHGCVRDGDTVARLGGDEFAILLEDLEDPIDAVRTTERLLAALQAPFRISGREVFSHASVGIAMGSPGRTGADDLLRDADMAMYLAKGKGKSRYELFEPALHATLLGRLQLQAELHQALERGDFILHYQPIVALETGRTVGVEALLRWRHEERGTVPPLEFIALAEETGLIVPIGRWVLEEACAQARRWRDRFPAEPPRMMSVNLSARQLQDPGFVDAVAAALATSGLDPDELVLEITENVLLEHTEATVDRLAALRRLGVRIAMDDFRTGYSSLAYLHRFPIDILKIDRSFVEALAGGREEGALVRAIMKLGETLRLETVAEGIESARQVTQLRSMGCRLGQGYLFDRPLDVAAMEARLAGETAGVSARDWSAAPAAG